MAKVHSFVLIGIDAIVCEVEVEVSQRGLSKTTVVGLAQVAVKESIERVRRPIINWGYAFPSHAILINRPLQIATRHAFVVEGVFFSQ